MNGKPSYQALLKERNRLLKLLTDWPPVLRGTIRHHGNKCGNPHCRCRNIKKPMLHGPYHYLSHRYRDKTQTIFLTDVKIRHARQWTANYKRLIQTIYRLSEVNFKLLRYHHDKLDSRK